MSRLGDEQSGPTWAQLLAVVGALAGAGGIGSATWSKGAATASVAQVTDPMARRVEVIDERLRWVEWRQRSGGCERVDAAEQGPPAPPVRLPRLEPAR